MFVIDRSSRPPTGSEGAKEEFDVLGATGAGRTTVKHAFALGGVL